MVRIESTHYPIVSAGVDWLSMRTSDFDISNAYQALASDVFSDAKTSGEKVEHSVRLGFGGRAVNGFFLGHKEEKSLITVSSSLALKYAPVLLRLGGSVARIDLQVTIDTGLDSPNLASLSYYRAKVMPLSGGRPRELKLTQTHPAGDTLNVNKRTSDHYGRLYDWGAAHSQDKRHRFWRYEVEFKRSLAKHIASCLAHRDDVQAVTSNLVSQWYNSRLPDVCFSPEPTSWIHEALEDSRPRDVLRWFEESLSKTVARAIKDYGQERTLNALGLGRLSIPNK